MPLIVTPKILCQQVKGPVLVAIVAGQPRYELRDIGYNLAPLDKTWYELQWWAISSRTYRIAKRSDHTGLLVKTDTAGFNEGFVDLIGEL